MKQYLLFCLLFLVTTNIAAAEEPQVDDTFDMVINRNVSYVPLKIDKTQEQLQTLDIYTKEGGDSLLPRTP